MTTLNFVRRGAGTPLVLVHGIGHRWQGWEPILDTLAAYHDVIAVDLPGFGGSRVPAREVPTDMASMVCALEEFFDHLGLRLPHVAGNSLGGAIALELGACGLAGSVTVFSPIGFFDDHARRRSLRILRLMRATTFQPRPVLRATLGLSAVRNLVFGQIMARPERVTAERAMDETLALRRGVGFVPVARWCRRYSFVGIRDERAMPVTIAWGSEDRIIPPDQADRARTLLPHARHLALPRCGHVPMSDDPDLTARLVLETTGALGRVHHRPRARRDGHRPHTAQRAWLDESGGLPRHP